MSSRTLALAGVAAAFLVPRRVIAAAPTLCPVRLITGRPCPTCGMTRSWSAAGHGDLRGAFELHPFGPPTLAAAAAFAVVGPRALDWPPLRSPRVVGLAATAWMATWLLRFVRRSAT